MAIPIQSLPAPEPSQTIYIKRINERAAIDDVKSTLHHLASKFGNVVDIVAKSSVNRKGQAFVVFDTVDQAVEAQEALNGFSIFEKQILVEFARTPSDKTVEKRSPAELEQWKRTRGVEKERKQAAQAALTAQTQQKRPLAATQAAASSDPRPSKAARTGLRSTAGGASGVVPDEYLPPNKILFIQNIPDGYERDELTGLFGKFAGFKEVRMVPSRKGIAFVEYSDEESSIKAKNEMANTVVADKMLKVTYQRQ